MRPQKDDSLLWSKCKYCPAWRPSRYASEMRGPVHAAALLQPGGREESDFHPLVFHRLFRKYWSTARALSP